MIKFSYVTPCLVRVTQEVFMNKQIIVCFRENNVIPAVYALLPNKQSITYTRLLTELKNLQLGLNPETVMTDFEQAAMNSFSEEFPVSQQRGCFFHFNQSIWRKIQALGLQRRYETDDQFALQVYIQKP